MSLVKEAGHRAGPLAETPVSLGAGAANRIQPVSVRHPRGVGSLEERPSCTEAEHLLSRVVRPSGTHPLPAGRRGAAAGPASSRERFSTWAVLTSSRIHAPCPQAVEELTASAAGTRASHFSPGLSFLSVKQQKVS